MSEDTVRDTMKQAMKALVAINANVGDLANSAVQVEVQHAINALALDLRHAHDPMRGGRRVPRTEASA